MIIIYSSRELYFPLLKKTLAVCGVVYEDIFIDIFLLSAASLIPFNSQRLSIKSY